MKQISKRLKDSEFIDLYNKYNNQELAKKLNYSRQTIIHKAKKLSLGQKPRGREKKDFSKYDTMVLKNLYKENKTKDMAKILEVSIPTLLKELKSRGIKIKKIGGQYNV